MLKNVTPHIMLFIIDPKIFPILVMLEKVFPHMLFFIGPKISYTVEKRFSTYFIFLCPKVFPRLLMLKISLTENRKTNFQKPLF